MRRSRGTPLRHARQASPGQRRRPAAGRGGGALVKNARTEASLQVPSTVVRDANRRTAEEAAGAVMSEEAVAADADGAHNNDDDDERDREQ